ncbi:MAG: response regulator [Desulfobacterales bacterium]|jgi:DNA-binding NtrC family response regulator
MKNEKRTVLIVDDEKFVLDVEALMMEKMGFHTLKANSPEQAYQIYKLEKDNIDLVILDMIMPGDNGAEAYQKLKRINSGIKVLVSSGFWCDAQVKQILSDKQNSFIQKPFKYEELNEKVDSILSE